MSKNKKIVLIIAFIFLCSGLLIFSLKIEFKTSSAGKPLLEFLNQDEINIDDIKSVQYVRYTEGGDNTVEYTDKSDIESLYNMIKSIKVGNETNRACEDNTRVYTFYMKNDKKFTIEIECDWIVIENKRYEIIKD